MFNKGAPNSRAVDGYRSWPVGNWASQQQVSSGQASEASTATPHRSHYHLNHPPLPRTLATSVEKLSSKKMVHGAKNLGTTVL